MSIYLYAAGARAITRPARDFGHHPNFRNPRPEDVAIYGVVADYIWSREVPPREVLLDLVRLGVRNHLHRLLERHGRPLDEVYADIDAAERERREPDRWQYFAADWRPGGWRHLAGMDAVAEEFSWSWECAVDDLLDLARCGEPQRLGEGWGAHVPAEDLRAIGVVPRER